MPDTKLQQCESTILLSQKRCKRKQYARFCHHHRQPVPDSNADVKHGSDFVHYTLFYTNEEDNETTFMKSLLTAIGNAHPYTTIVRFINVSQQSRLTFEMPTELKKAMIGVQYPVVLRNGKVLKGGLVDLCQTYIKECDATRADLY
jgi:hypothetical protein